MPDQSLQYERSGKTDAGSDNPGDTSANTPAASTTESQESNVRRASEGETQQADVTINRDPTIGDEDAGPSRLQNAANPAGTDYDDEAAWPYRRLQSLAKSKGLPGDGKREELVARIRQSDESGQAPDEGGEAGLGGAETRTTGPESTDAPSAEVDPDQVVNGGITRTDAGSAHASLLQGLSQQRKQQQLEQIRERNERVTETG